MRKIVIANQKGGVGKTTTAVNLASGLAYAGKRTLLIDMDPQANATFAVIGLKQSQATIYELLMSNNYSVADVILSTNQPGLDLIPSNIDLSAAESELIGSIDGRVRLRSKLEAQLDPAAYDYLVIDAPPSLGLLTINALAATTEIIIPIEPSVFGLQGIDKLENTIKLAKKHLDCPDLTIIGVLRTKYEQTNVARDTTKVLRQHFGDTLLKTVIPKNVKLEEAHSRSKSIFAYDSTSAGAATYAKMVSEIMAKEVMAYA